MLADSSTFPAFVWRQNKMKLPEFLISLRGILTAVLPLQELSQSWNMCVVVWSLLSLSEQRTCSNYRGLPSWETDCRVAGPEIPLEPGCLVLCDHKNPLLITILNQLNRICVLYFLLFCRLLLGLPRRLLAPDFLAKLSCIIFVFSRAC